MLILGFGVLGARVGQLQLASGAKYKELSVKLALHTIPLTAQRGSVFDRNGRDLAMSIEKTTVYADPTLVTDPVAEAARLAPVLHVDEHGLLQSLSARGSAAAPRRFVYVAHTVPDAVAQAVQALKLPGIGFVPESARSYPAGAVAASVIGRVRSDGPGLDGIEKQYDSWLAGKPGKLVVEQDPLGHDIPDTQETRVDAQRGTDVVLSLDEDLQWQAEYSLLDQVKATGAKSGMAVVVDVTNGDVLAMASVHGATPTTPAGVAGPGDNNAPLTDLFEPGSTNKLITLSWALEHGHITPDTKFLVPYSLRVDPHVAPYQDAEPHVGVPNGIEHWTTADILRESSNVGTIEIAQRMKNQEVADGLRAFGLGEQTAIQWPYQPAGLLIPRVAVLRHGQVLDRDRLRRRGDRHADARRVRDDRERRRHAAAAPARRDDRREGRAPSGRRPRRRARRVDEHRVGDDQDARGSGRERNRRVRRHPRLPRRGQDRHGEEGAGDGRLHERGDDGLVHRLRAGRSSAFATLVVLDENNLSYGGEVAAPVFSEITQFALQQYGVRPTDLANTQYSAAQATAQVAGSSCSVPHGSDLVAAQLRLQAQAASSQHQAQTRLTGSVPAAGTTVGGGGATSGRSQSTAGPATAADSLPPDPSKHT